MNTPRPGYGRSQAVSQLLARNTRKQTNTYLFAYQFPRFPTLENSLNSPADFLCDRNANVGHRSKLERL